MQNTGDIKAEFLIRSQTSTSVGFLTDEILNDWIDTGHKWAAGYKKWPFTEGRVSTTFASLVTNEDGYLVGEYPEGWKSDSMRMLMIGGKRVNKKNFYQLQKFLEENPNDNERIFSDYGRRVYINPRIDLSGSVTAWGQYTPATLDGTDPTAATVFSSGEEDGNEAIVEAMMSYWKKRAMKLGEANKHMEEAKRILDDTWDKVKGEQFAYQPTDSEGMFERIDVVDGSYRKDNLKRDQFN